MKKLRESGKHILRDIKEYGWAAVIFAVYYVLVHLFRTAFCPLIHVTGLPCAGCGLTRAFLFMLRGEFARAFYIQPMAYIILIFLLYCGWFRYIKGTKIKGFKPLFAILIIAMLAFYAVRMFLYFPDRVPYVYTQDNIFASRYPMYGEFVEAFVSWLKSVRS